MGDVTTLHPNARDREQVRVLSACGASPEFIAHEIGTSTEIVKHYYAKDISLGLEDANAQVALTFFKLANSGEHPQLTLAWLKMRAGWKEAGQSQIMDAPDIAAAREKLNKLLERKQKA